MKSKAMRRLLLLTALALAATTISSSASATFSGRDGRVVGSRGRSLYTMNPNGTAVRQLTHPPHGWADGGAQWSPDGTSVVFVRGTLDGNRQQIYTINADGTGLTKLTSCTASDPDCSSNTTPAWTPDGKTIVFSHCCVAGNGGTLVGLYTMQSDGSNMQQITLNPDIDWGDFSPVVSPDGKWVAFTRAIAATPGNGDQSIDALFIVGIDGTNLHQIVPYSQLVDEKTWSPDGSRIVFTSHAGSNTGPFRADLFSVAPDGSNLTQLTHTTPGATWACCATWAPSGDRIMFEHSTPSGIGAIETMLPDGKHIHLVADQALNVVGEPNWGTAPEQCHVPAVRGRLLATAKQAIEHSHCALGHVTKEPSHSVAAGRVISQRPTAGTYLADNAPVGLIVSTG
jgi:Tol biopolymer transport system component